MGKVKKPFYKRWWVVVLAAFFILGGIGAALDKGEEKAKEEPDKVETSAPAKETKPDTEEKKEAVTDDSEKDYYINEVLPSINAAVEEYDNIWSALWTPTFTGFSDGTVDAYSAYESIKQLEIKYTALMKQIDQIDGKKLSKENLKLLKEFKAEFKDAALMRKSSGDKAMKMIDKGTFSPSDMDDVLSTVEISDRSALRAMVSKIEIESDLGITE